MTDEKKARISELTGISRERELTAEEKREREALREEYLAEWRRGAEEALGSTFIVDGEGRKTPLKKKHE